MTVDWSGVVLFIGFSLLPFVYWQIARLERLNSCKEKPELDVVDDCFKLQDQLLPFSCCSYVYLSTCQGIWGFFHHRTVSFHDFSNNELASYSFSHRADGIAQEGGAGFFSAWTDHCCQKYTAALSQGKVVMFPHRSLKGSWLELDTDAMTMVSTGYFGNCTSSRIPLDFNTAIDRKNGIIRVTGLPDASIVRVVLCEADYANIEVFFELLQRLTAQASKRCNKG